MRATSRDPARGLIDPTDAEALGSALAEADALLVTVAPTSDTASNTANTNQTPDPHSQNTTKSKRRAGRSAVPSWDEILFGD